MTDEKYEPPERDPETGKFLPGNKGGPGRPTKEKTISDVMLKHLQDGGEDVPSGKGRQREHKSYLQMFVESQIKRAINGDRYAAQNVWERIEGKVALQVGGTEQGEPIRFIIDKEMEGI